MILSTGPNDLPKLVGPWLVPADLYDTEDIYPYLVVLKAIFI